MCLWGISFIQTKNRNQVFTLNSYNPFILSGETGIRTLGTVTRSPHFECGPIDHSGISPKRLKRLLKIQKALYRAERQGFEPRVPRGTTVFKTAAIDHSATSPILFENTHFSKALQRYRYFLNTQNPSLFFDSFSQYRNFAPESLNKQTHCINDISAEF